MNILYWCTILNLTISLIYKSVLVSSKKFILLLFTDCTSRCLYLSQILQTLTNKTNLRINPGNERPQEDSGSAEMHVCLKCNKQFTLKSSLTRHMNLHLGRFKFYCDQCEKGFSDNRDYKVHMDKHAGIMYRCTICTKSFCTERRRDYHMSSHTRIYRLTCNVCGRGFNEQNIYDKHSRQHLSWVLSSLLSQFSWIIYFRSKSKFVDQWCIINYQVSVIPI